jgi:hypothetical protein
MHQSSAATGAAGAAPPPDAPASGQQGDSVEVRLDLKVERPGEKQKIMGYDAERVFITFTSEFLVTPEGEEQAQQAGTLVIFMDSWSASGVPAEEAQKRMAESVGPELRSQSTQMAGTFMSAFSSDPKARAAVAEAAAEAGKLAGFELKGTMHLVLVPPGLTFDRDRALSDAEGGGGVGGAVKRGLGGLLRGAASVDRDEPNADDPKQGTIARVRTEVRDMKTGEVPASLFEPPADYREIVFGAGG